MTAPLPHLDRLWADRPHLPRAVAAILAFSEADGRFGDLLTEGEVDLAATVLAESLAARADFTATYALPWRPCLTVIDALIAHGTRHAERTGGEGVLSALPALLFERLGYTDALAGHTEAPTRPRVRGTVEDPGPVETPQLSEAEREGVVRRIDAVMGHNYDRGFTAGTAERLLVQSAPDLLAALDTELSPWYTAATATGELDDHALATRARALRSSTPEPLRPLVRDYLRGRLRTIRLAAAIRRLGSLTGPTGLLDTGRALRAHATASAAAGPVATPARTADRRAALLAAALAGLDDAAVASLLRTGDGAMPVDVVLDAHPRDRDRAAVARTLYRALADGGPGRRWPLPVSGLVPATVDEPAPLGETLALAGVAAPEAPLSPGLAGQLERLAERLVVAPGARRLHPAAWTAAADLPLPEVGADLALMERLKVRHTVPTSAESAVRWYLRHRLGAAMAPALLAAHDPGMAHRLAAERTVIEQGGDRALDVAERWLETYAAEAATGTGTEGTLAYAACLVLAAALRERATAEARHFLANAVPDAGALINAPTPVIQGALAATSRHVERTRHHAPRFADRLLWALAAVALSWLQDPVGAAAITLGGDGSE